MTLIYVCLGVLRVKDFGIYSGNKVLGGKKKEKNVLSLVAKELLIDNSTKEVGVGI